jgi:hypothetical protein
MSEHEVKKPNRTAIGTNSMKKILKLFWMGYFRLTLVRVNVDLS